MSKPVDSRSVSRWTITLDEERRPWQIVKRREEWANIDTGLRLEVGTGESKTEVILRATVAWDYDRDSATYQGTKVPGAMFDQLDELSRVVSAVSRSSVWLLVACVFLFPCSLCCLVLPLLCLPRWCLG